MVPTEIGISSVARENKLSNHQKKGGSVKCKVQYQMNNANLKRQKNPYTLNDSDYMALSGKGKKDEDKKRKKQ